MVDYAGETYIIEHEATGFDGELLTADDVERVSLQIFAADDTAVVDGEDMDWNEERQRWVYKWHSPGPDAGKYRLWVTIHGPDDDVSFELKRVRLVRDPRG